MKIELDIDDDTLAYLTVLGSGRGQSPEEVIYQLIDHAIQGVYRPGSWERPWIEQAFGAIDETQLTRDPDTPFYLKPRTDG
jgi:hypothetical protein